MILAAYLEAKMPEYATHAYLTWLEGLPREELFEEVSILYDTSLQKAQELADLQEQVRRLHIDNEALQARVFALTATNRTQSDVLGSIWTLLRETGL